jgi:hypothetical protein
MCFVHVETLTLERHFNFVFVVLFITQCHIPYNGSFWDWFLNVGC